MANRRPKGMTNLDWVILNTSRSANGCWESNLGLHHIYSYLQVNKKRIYVHRLMYEELKGTITPGMWVCHTCDNPRCWRPSHLFLGTPQDNALDMIAKGRFVGNLKYSEDQICALAIEHPEYTSKNIAKQFGCWHGTVSKCLEKHGLARGALKGAQHTKAKLTEEDVYYIRRSKESGLKLAEKFGVQHPAIYAIKKRVNWKHLPEEPAINIEEKP